jgi:hypothetical protein
MTRNARARYLPSAYFEIGTVMMTQEFDLKPLSKEN